LDENLSSYQPGLFMNMHSKGSFGRGKTLTDADRSVVFGVQELLPRPILFLFTDMPFCFMNNSG
jgi:hypothetical protein